MTFTPTVHLNGTAKQELIDQQIKVIGATRILLGAMRNAQPNGRDYYPQGSAAFPAARDIWAAHIDAIRALHEECEARAMRIDGGKI